MSDKLSTMARVTLTVELALTSGWGPDCTMEQIHRQASDEAIGRLRNLRTANGGFPNIKIIGEPTIDMVTATVRP